MEEMIVVPYLSAVGGLMFAMLCTRPNIAHVASGMSSFFFNPGKEHWEAVNWILRSLKGTSKLCLCFWGTEPVLEGYTNSDMVGNLDGRKSTSLFYLLFQEDPFHGSLKL